MERSPFLFELSEKGSVQRAGHFKRLQKDTWRREGAVWNNTYELRPFTGSLAKFQ